MPDLTVVPEIDAFMGSAGQPSMRANLGLFTGSNLEANPRDRPITLGVRVNAGAVPVGPIKANIPLLVTGVITGWAVVCDGPSTVVLDIWKRNGNTPSVSDSMTNVGGGGVKPSVTAGVFASGNVDNWTGLTVAVDDIIEVNVDSNDVATGITITLSVQQD